MTRLGRISAYVALSLAWACSGEVSAPGSLGGDGTMPAAASGMGTGGVVPGVAGSAGGMVAAPTPATPSAAVDGTTATPTGSAPAESTGAPAETGSLTEASGYTPVLNPDGSIARPMWLDGEATFTRFARLTNEQWQRSVRDLLHLSELPTEESQFFEQIGAGATDFINDQSRLQMSNTQWAQYQRAAEALAARVSETDEAMQAVHAGTDPDAFVREFGLRAFRRPLTDQEAATYRGVFDTGATLSGTQSEFTKGAGLVIETMLQSPHFLYRTELGESGTPLSGYEAAAKLSLYILRTMPSDELLAKAGRGELDTIDAVVNEARAMLDTEDAAETFQAFHAELFELNRFTGISKSDPIFTEAVATELVDASEAFFDRIYTEGYGVREILTTRSGYVGPATAQFYGISPAPSALQEMELPEERAGFFTQLPYLMYFARDMQSYAVLRGVHINTEVLCVELPLLGVPAPPLPDIEYTTSREYMEKGTMPCGGECHGTYINTLGFSMENFDGLGRVRELDNGVPVDTASEYPFVGGLQSFQDAADLMRLISENEMAHECYSRYIASYGLGRSLSEEDHDLVSSLASVSLDENASTKELVLALINSPEFNTRGGGNQ